MCRPVLYLSIVNQRAGTLTQRGGNSFFRFHSKNIRMLFVYYSKVNNKEARTLRTFIVLSSTFLNRLLTYFKALFFPIPLETEKTKGFLMFSEGIEETI